MKTLRDIAFAGKKVLVRVDFNVPMNDAGQITDDLRIRTVLPTLQYLIAEKARVILCTHMGRPKGQRVEKYSLAPVAAYTAQLLGMPVVLAPDCIGPEVEAAVNSLGDGQLLMLENLRFHPQEERNDPDFSRQLASLADVYVNDAFGTAHRAEATTHGIARFAPVACAGPLLAAELDALGRAFSEPKRPLLAIVGGSKVSTKLSILRSLAERVDRLIVGGGIANTFMLAAGLPIGKSLAEPDLVDEARAIMKMMADRGATVPIPTDVVVATEFSPNATATLRAADAVQPDETLLVVDAMIGQDAVTTAEA